MKLVVDASVALKWFFKDRVSETDTAAAAEILTGYVERRYQLIAPPHFLAEMAAVLAREVPETAIDNFADLVQLAIPVRGDVATYARAMQLSVDLDHHLFDTLYHAVALETNSATLITADLRYVRRANTIGRVLPLAHWRAPR